ncbi:unnamed protein product, partial [Allacma fusca]
MVAEKEDSSRAQTFNDNMISSVFCNASTCQVKRGSL